MQKESAPQAFAARPSTGAARVGRARGRPGRLDAFDVGVLIAWFLASLWLLGVILAEAAGTPRVWSGVEGLIGGDQAQYLAWIRDSARHGLMANLFRLDPTPANFLHPGLVISGRLVALGLPAWLAQLAWKPVAMLVLFFLARAYIRRNLATKTARRCALVIALFFSPPTVLLIPQLDLSVWTVRDWNGTQFDLSLLNTMWGYPFEALSVAALIGALFTYERDRVRHSIGPWPPLLGLLAAWLQPWQGGTLILVLAGAEAVLWFASRSSGPGAAPAEPDRRRILRLGGTVTLTVLPLAYFAILGATDPSWAQVKRVGGTDWSAGSVVACLAVLVIPAIAAYARVPREFGPITLRLWPVAGLMVFIFIALSGAGTFPPHALIGFSIPLGILAVQGVGRLMAGRRIAPVWAGLATAVLVVPPLAWQFNNATEVVARGSRPDFLGSGNPYLLDPGDDRAMSWLDDSTVRGGVLARGYLGQLVPGLTGRRTWIGNVNWTPDYPLRNRRINTFFSGALGQAGTVRFAQASGARFVLATCDAHAPARFDQALAPVVLSARRFGCATIYQITSGAPGPASTSAPGFSSPERGDQGTWRWAVRPVAALGFSNLSARPQPVVFSAQLSAPPGRRIVVSVRYPDGATSRVALSGAPSKLGRAFTLPPRGGAVTFSTTQPASHRPPDPRSLYFQVLDASLAAARRR